MKAIILAAGEGKRMHPNVEPKCLLHYKGVSIIIRLIKQLNQCGVEDIIVVVGYKKEKVKKEMTSNNVIILENDIYKNDININSMRLAMNKAIEKPDDIVVFEADIVMEDAFVEYTVGTDFENKSVWFTCGKLKTSGGMIKTDGKNNVVDIRVDKYSKKYKDYDKLTGIMRISRQHAKRFSDILNKETKNQYYLISWADNIETLPSVKGESQHFLFGTFNTLSEYNDVLDFDCDNKNCTKSIYLANVSELLPIEKYDEKRLLMVENSVVVENFWVIPLKIEKEHNLILDGHHSLEVAKRLELKCVPVIGFDYDEVDMWSLREELRVTKGDVIRNAVKGIIFPFKSIKHKFPNVIYKCSYQLDGLR